MLERPLSARGKRKAQWLELYLQKKYVIILMYQWIETVNVVNSRVLMASYTISITTYLYILRFSAV